MSLRNKRLSIEYKKILKCPIDKNIIVKVDENNLSKWYFILYDDDKEYDEPAEIVFSIEHSQDYPMKPSDFKCLTPSGVFVTDALICTSFSGFHKESWDISMTTEKMIIGLVSFYNIVKECPKQGGVGTQVLSLEQRKTLAKGSREYNRTKLNPDVRKILFKN